jgi:PKD domain-containing protein/Big-like domain-containing protein
MARCLSLRSRCAVLAASMLAVMAALVPVAAQAADSHATPSSFASMFSAAQGGDTVFLASGSYGTFNGGSKASMVTVAAEPGATPTMSGGNFNSSVRNITIRGVTFTGAVEVAPGSTVMGLIFDGDTWGNVGHAAHEGRLSIIGGGLASGNGVQVKNSTFGPGGCSDGIQDSSRGTEIGPNNEFKGIVQGGCSEHADAIQPYASNNVYIHDNYMHDNEQGIMSPDGVSTGYRITNNVIHTTTGYPCMHLGDTRSGSVTHNVCRNGSIRVYGGNQNVASQSMVVQNNAAGIDASACSGCTIDHNQSVTYTGGTGRCGFATASPKGTASDGTDIGLNSCSGTPPPPPPPADTTAPETTITSAPADPSTSTGASIGFNSNESGSTFACKLDTGAYAACTSPKAYSGLSAGSHTVSVRATDAAGNTDATPAAWTWTISAAPDTTAPETTITSGPANPTTSTSSSSGFTSDESGSTFDCKLDAAAYASCSSPKTNSGLSMGSHTFSVRATDVAGNMDATPASQTWMIQSAPPADSQPVAAYVYSPTTPAAGQAVSFDASSATCADAPCTYSWADDGGDGAAGTQWPLGSGQTMTFTFQGTGVKNVRLVVTDADGDTNSTMKVINVVAAAPPADTTAPNTTMSSGPNGATTNATTTNDSTPTFAFTSTESGSTFQCQADSGSWSSCASPWTTSTLSDGAHSVAVRATDAAGNTDASPATRSFTVATATPSQTLIGNSTVQPAANSNTAGTAEAFRTNATASGSAISMSVYVAAGNTASTLVVGIYSNVSGHPGALLTKGARSALTAGTWNTVTVPATSLTSGKTYWVGLLGTGGTLTFRGGAAGGCRSEGSSSSSLTTLPATWQTGAVWGSCAPSAYATS